MSLHPFYRCGGLEGALGMHSRLTSRERCTMSPA